MPARGLVTGSTCEGREVVGRTAQADNGMARCGAAGFCAHRWLLHYVHPSPAACAAPRQLLLRQHALSALRRRREEP